ncbi:hypothetical protein AVEN_107293-1, partial [Araneus ventricosus]
MPTLTNSHHRPHHILNGYFT